MAIDYAMNTACSGRHRVPFLEECTHGDLGLTVTEITEDGHTSRSAGPFQGRLRHVSSTPISARRCSRAAHGENVHAGVVLVIVRDCVGQGRGAPSNQHEGVLPEQMALNRAVACPRVECLDEAMILPPGAELLGALGVGLLALERSPSAAGLRHQYEHPWRTPPWSMHGRFTCEAYGD